MAIAKEKPRDSLELQWDYRLGNVSRLSLMRGEDLMLVPQEILKSVAFVAVKRNSGFHVGGTCFFLSEKTGCERWIHYIVTAGHVINAIKDRANDGKVYLRANLKAGGSEFVATELTDWVFHDNPRIDVAAMIIESGGELLDHLYFGCGSFVTQDVIDNEPIGPGTELVFPGLFTKHFGTARNEPIVRTGAIAAIPNEPVETKMGPMPAYLAEARSIGGFSGSPVFCAVTTKTGGARWPVGTKSFYFFGMMHGHYGVNGKNWDLENDPIEPDSAEARSINMGIAILVRSHEVRELLDQEHFVRARTIYKRAYEATHKANSSEHGY